MKRVIKKIIGIAVLSTGMVSCNSEFLDKYPLDSPSNSTFFSNETELTMAVNSAYKTLMWVYHSVPVMMWLDASTDISWSRGDFGLMLSLQQGNVTTESQLFRDTWRHYYNSVMRCNNILENMHRAKDVVSEDFYNRIEAETKFLRAWSYGYLTAFYGDVPLLTKTIQLDEAQVPRTPKQEILDMCYEDLDFAAAHLPNKWTGADEGRITRGAAMAFKARIALWNNQYDIAATAAKQVIDWNDYNIYSNYERLFKLEGSNSTESILNLPFVLNFQTSQIPRYLGNSLATGYSVLTPTQHMVDMYQCTDGKRIDESPLFNPASPYDNRDPRLKQSILRPGEWFNGFLFETHPDATTTQQNINGNIATVNNREVTNQFATFTGYLWKKYVDESELPELIARSELDFMLIRYAEVLLTYAEAKIEENEIDDTVIDAINKVRRRPGVLMPAADMAMSQSDLRDLVRYERTVELTIEGMHYFDVRRWKTAEHVVPGNLLGRRHRERWDDLIVPNFSAYGKSQYPNETDVFQVISVSRFNPSRDYLWPIPQRERDLNSELTQNPNW